MSINDDFEKRRNELYILNTNAWNGNDDVFKTNGNLDTSLKKNTAFIKKIRTGITKENEKQFIDGIKTTSLEKYLNEVSSALCETLSKVSKNADVPSAVEIVSALHQRFTSNFTPFIELYFAHSFIHPAEKLQKKDEKELIIKVRNLLKLTMEFFLVGIFRSVNDMPETELPTYLHKLKAAKKDNIPLIVPIVKQVMTYDFESGVTLPIMISFLKRFGSILYEQNTRFSENYCAFLRKLFSSYIQNAVSLTETYYKRIMKTKATAKTIAIKTGKIVTDMETRVEELELTFEEFKAFCEYACPLTKISLPVLEVEIEKETSKVTIVQSTSKQNQIWDNEEMRRFYEDIPSLESLVTQEVLDSANSKIQAGEIKGSKMADIILRLDSVETDKEVDAIVTDFWEWGLSNKASRKRLSKHIVELKDVTKFKNIARFLKINEIYFDKCIDDLITRLDKSFRFQIHHDTIAEKDIIVFAELIKFKMIPIHVIFHKIRTLILNIEVNNNIDLLSLMFENCSKMLLYDDEYKDYTNELIQLLLSLYKVKKFTHTDKYAVKVFLLSLNPPKPRKENRVELLKEEKFFNYLIKTQLNARTYKLIANMIKCADWNNPVIYNRIRIILSRPSDINYINIRYLADILKLLTSEINGSLRTIIIDQVVEDITVGLEENNYQQSRMRISQCIYFIEMINLNIIHKDNLIPMLYKILCSGHTNNYPKKDSVCELDEPNDHFRIRLISIMLMKLELNKINKTKINLLITFITFFNYYIFTKIQPLAVDLNNNVDDAFKYLDEKLKINFTRSLSYEEALENLQQQLDSDEAKPSDGTKEVEGSTCNDGNKDGNDDDNENDNEDDNEDGNDDEDDIEIDYDEDDDIVDIVDEIIEDGGIIDVNKAIGLAISSDHESDNDSDGDIDESDDDSDDEDDDVDDDDDEDDENGSDGDADSDIDESDDSDFGEDDNDGNIAVISDDNENEENSTEAFHEAELDIEFRKILDESLQNTAGTNSAKGVLSDKIGTPEAIMYNLKKNVEEVSTSTNNNGMKFTLLSRTGKKVQSKDIILPQNAKIAISVTKEQERIRLEKDKIKSFVLKSVQ